MAGTHGDRVTESPVANGAQPGPVADGAAPVADGARPGARADAAPGAAMLRLVEVMDTLRGEVPVGRQADA